MALKLKLPGSIIGPSDLARLRRELENFNEAQHQADLRVKNGGKGGAVRLGRVLEELATTNSCDLSVAKQREVLLHDLDEAVKTAPTITMSFAADPSAAFMAKIIAWLRTTVHPQVLVRVGLQPNIAAGCIVRTPSKLYDFSLRHKFTEQRQVLIDSLRKADAQRTELKAPAKEAAA